MEKIRSTTVLAVVHNGEVAIGADGQATMGNTVAKNHVRKIRKMLDGKIVTGFAGSTADAFTLLERFEEKIKCLWRKYEACKYRISQRLAYRPLFTQIGSYDDCCQQRRNLNYFRNWRCA
eukprot:Opistho-1_new@89554